MNIKNTSRKNLTKSDYKKAAKVLKDAGLFKADLRKTLSPYQKTKLRKMIKGDDSALYTMAKNHRAAKVRKHFIELANKHTEYVDVNNTKRLTIDPKRPLSDSRLVNEMKNFTRLYADGAISKNQYMRLRGEYRQLIAQIRNNNQNYGRMDFVKKKVSKKEAELLKPRGWIIKDGYAYLPSNVINETKFKGIYYYHFSKNIRMEAMVETNKNKLHPYRYYLLGTPKELTKLLEILQANGIDKLTYRTNSLIPDNLYTSPSTSKNVQNSLHESIADLLFYMSTIVMKPENKNLSDSHKNQIMNQMIASINIASSQTPRGRIK